MEQSLPTLLWFDISAEQRAFLDVRRVSRILGIKPTIPIFAVVIIHNIVTLTPNINSPLPETVHGGIEMAYLISWTDLGLIRALVDSNVPRDADLPLVAVKSSLTSFCSIECDLSHSDLPYSIQIPMRRKIL